MSRLFRSTGARVIGFIAVVMGAYVGAISLHLVPSVGWHTEPVPVVQAVAEEVLPLESVRRDGADGLLVPASVASKMGLNTAQVSSLSHNIRLPSFQGVLALDSDRLSRVHSRFEGEVVEIGQSTDGSDPTMRVGEHVQRGDLLAVIWSTDLGKKKSELIDSLTKLRAEEDLRDRLKKLFEDGAGAGRTYRDAERDVQARQVEIASIERTLRTWRLTDTDIDAIRAESSKVCQSQKLATDQSGWARVEVRAPMSGVILEKNVVVGDMVDTSTDLFKIGQLNTLTVWAHVYEEDLPLLESLPRPLSWKITLPSRPGFEFNGSLEKVGAVIDPAQHTALVTGRVENPAGDLKIGQFVSVEIELPPPSDQLALPSTAVVEDGRQSVVFLQSSPQESRFVRRPVQVIRRSRDEVYVKSATDTVKPGDLIVTTGSLLLQSAFEQLPAPAGESATAETAVPTIAPALSPAATATDLTLNQPASHLRL